jgi:PDZ domain-containing protein
VSEPDDAKQPTTQPAPDTSGGEHRGMQLTRRGWTVLMSMLIVLAFGLVGSLVRVPYVSLGPGPTHDTLAKSEDGPVIAIDGRETYPTSGELRLTTVSVNDGITLLGALGLWVSGRHALAPREIYYPPGETDEDVQKENTRQFQDSQGAAVSAALRHLKKSGVEWAKDIKFGVIVKQITTDAPADKVLDPGDQLIKVNGRTIRKAQDPRIALKKTRPNDKISVTYRPEGKHDPKDNRTGTITLGKAPDRKIGYMGIEAGLHPEIEDFEVDIKLADVGGPSAGMMFALAIVDRLTPGELTGGRHVAGTGEITDDGRIGAIGGISFKLASARDDGATVFLVPEGNCAEAVESAPDGVRLVKVGTLDDAVDALEKLDAGEKPPSC